jgi:hypothetical protein
MAKNFYEAFKTEDNLEIDGIWKEYAGGLVRIKIARAGNKNTSFNKAITKAHKKYKNAGTDTKEDQARPWAEVYVNSVIKSFEVKDEDGNWVEGIYLPDEKGNISFQEASKENIMKVLLDLPDLFDALQDDAKEMETFKKEEEEQDLKN